MKDDQEFPIDLDFGREDDEVAPTADAEFDAWLARVAPAIDAANEAPTAEMWDVIAARTAASSGEVPGVIALVPGRSRSRGWMWPAAVAAAMLIGIGVDRIAVRGEKSVRVAAATRSSDSVVAPLPTVRDSSGVATTDGASSGTASPRIGAGAVPHNAVRAPRRELASSGAGDRRGSEAGAPRSAVPNATPVRTSDLYHLAAVQTLGQAEALLVAYRASGLAERDPAAAKQLGAWGRDVLSGTRLLLDSPAGDDPAMRPLLNDLELVLVQIIRLSGAPLNQSERALIDRSLRERDLLPRIRTAVPAGALGATSDE